MIRAIILLALLWLGCLAVLVGYTDTLCQFDKAERDRATNKAMKYAWFITVTVAVFWWLSTLPSSTGGTWPEP